MSPDARSMPPPAPPFGGAGNRKPRQASPGLADLCRANLPPGAFQAEISPQPEVAKSCAHSSGVNSSKISSASRRNSPRVRGAVVRSECLLLRRTRSTADSGSRRSKPGRERRVFIRLARAADFAAEIINDDDFAKRRVRDGFAIGRGSNVPQTVFERTRSPNALRFNNA